MLLSVLNQKGGVGKTTLAVHLATAFAMEGAKVLLVDADPQGSALQWSDNRQGILLFPVIGLAKRTLHKELPALAKDYDHVFIDGPPRVAEVAKSAIVGSQLILIPVQPSPYDVWSAKEIVDLIEEAKEYNSTIRSMFVVNRKIANTAIGRDVVDALADFKVPVLAGQITQRVAFAVSAGQGMTVLETEPSGLAAQEIQAVVKEIKELTHAKDRLVRNHTSQEPAHR